MTLSIEFGYLCKPIGEQLEAQGIEIPESDAKLLDDISQQIIFLHLQDIIPDSARDSANKKLMRRIVSVVKREGVKL